MSAEEAKRLRAVAAEHLRTAEALEKKAQLDCPHPFSKLEFNYTGQISCSYKKTHQMFIVCKGCQATMKADLNEFDDP